MTKVKFKDFSRSVRTLIALGKCEVYYIAFVLA